MSSAGYIGRAFATLNRSFLCLLLLVFALGASPARAGLDADFERLEEAVPAVAQMQGSTYEEWLEGTKGEPVTWSAVRWLRYKMPGSRPGERASVATLEKPFHH